MYDKMQNKWWDHYNMENFVLIDDLEKSNAQALIAHLKRWLDIYPFPAEVKQGVCRGIRPKLIIITSNFHPANIFGEDSHLLPILRRCKILYAGEEELPDPAYPDVEVFDPVNHTYAFEKYKYPDLQELATVPLPTDLTGSDDEGSEGEGESLGSEDTQDVED